MRKAKEAAVKLACKFFQVDLNRPMKSTLILSLPCRSKLLSTHIANDDGMLYEVEVVFILQQCVRVQFTQQ